MEQIGARLRAIRMKWGLTLREVEERSEGLAEEWGNPAYKISASWLDRIERENRRLSAAKLIVLATIYSILSEQLLALCSRTSDKPPNCRNLSRPNRTLLLTEGPLEQHARIWLPDSEPTRRIHGDRGRV
jgi:transcriptional regulator with XRE-family HTH domain